MYFERNINILKKINPELAELIVNIRESNNLKVITSKTGFPSLKAGHITLHSLYDPVKEAVDWVEYCRERFKDITFFVVFGFGFGYHIAELCKATEKEVIIFEPRLDILKTAFELMDLTALLSRVKIFTGEEIPRLDKGFAVLEHKPSVNLNPEYFERLRSRLKVLQTINKGLRIMVVGPIYGGSLPIARYCAEAIRNLGHLVDLVDNNPYKEAFLGIDKITLNKMHQNRLREMFVAFASEAIVARCAEYKPDLLFALAQAPLSVSSLKKLRENKIPTAFWFVEDFRLRDYWKDVAPFYDYFFTIQKGKFFDQLKETGTKNFAYFPPAASKGIHKKLELASNEIEKYGSDISFVGAGYQNRRSFFTGLLDFDMKIWGSEWDMNSPLSKCIQKSGEWIETDDIVKIFNAAKININLHSSVYHNGVDPYGDFVNPRTFEIAACEGFQLADYRSEMSGLFRIGEEIVCFESLGDLRQKIKYYLDNPEERKSIALQGKERVMREHTYERRFEEMLRFMFSRGYEPPQWNSEHEDAESLIRAAGRDTELGEYLCQFSDKGKICLDDITEKIKSGEDSLSYVEKIFLLMNEMKKVYLKN